MLKGFADAITRYRDVRDSRNISVAQLADDGIGRLRRNHEALPGPSLEAGKPRHGRDRRNTRELRWATLSIMIATPPATTKTFMWDWHFPGAACEPRPSSSLM
jgi:hypothetical protein